jgi:hypothetical protein
MHLLNFCRQPFFSVGLLAESGGCLAAWEVSAQMPLSVTRRWLWLRMSKPRASLFYLIMWLLLLLPADLRRVSSCHHSPALWT